MGESFVEENLYFPTWMSHELATLAAKLRTDVGTVVWAAWEAAKQQLYQMTPLLDDIPPEGSLPSLPRVRLAPPPRPPTALVVPQSAQPISMPTDSKDKQILALRLPDRVIRELRSFAVGADQSLSWTLQQAIRLVRPRLHAATAR